MGLNVLSVLQVFAGKSNTYISNCYFVKYSCRGIVDF